LSAGGEKGAEKGIVAIDGGRGGPPETSVRPLGDRRGTWRSGRNSLDRQPDRERCMGKTQSAPRGKGESFPGRGKKELLQGV